MPYYPIAYGHDPANGFLPTAVVLHFDADAWCVFDATQGNNWGPFPSRREACSWAVGRFGVDLAATDLFCRGERLGDRIRFHTMNPIRRHFKHRKKYDRFRGVVVFAPPG